MSKEMKALTINGETYEIVDEYARSHSGSGSSAELEDIRLGADGKKFGTAGEAVRQQFRYVGGQIDHIEEEIQNIDSVFKDICYDSDGYKYSTPGDTIRMQFDSVKYSMENIDESIDHVMDVFDIIEEEVYDARIGADGVEYEKAGEAVRTQFSKLIRTTTRTIGFENTEFEYGKVLYGGAYRIGDVLSTVFGDGIYNYYLFRDVCVHKNEMLSIANGWKLKSDYFASVIVTDYSHVIKKIIPFDFFNDGGKYIAEEDVLITLSCEQYRVDTTEIFHVKKTVAYEPFVLNAQDAEKYLTNPTFGDEALDAILSGRQILVRVLNASGDNYVATYSPIYMYQLPNDKNNYLYLFYLKDEKQNIDLSALGLGTIQVPLYGELKLLLSENYNKTPLE